MVEVDNLFLVKWGTRVVYGILALGLLALIILAFLNAFDNLSFNNEKELIFEDEGSAQGEVLYVNVTEINGYSGVLGLISKVNDADVDAPLLTSNGETLKKNILFKNDEDIQWVSVKMPEDTTLVVGLVLSSPGAAVPWTLTVYTTTDLRVVPRIILPIILALLIVAIVIFEWRFHIYESRYGAGSEGQKRGQRRKTRFF